ncbi:MAG: hypothetical protein QG555_1641 [Thermodesulfobacteriota bacterium]|nr:hypothetical protein [Thermodesulfobacteriota bacterium]
MDRNKRCLYVAGLFLVFLLSACAGGKPVTLRSYSPAFTADLSAYQGKRVYLMNFDNQAQNTTNFAYFSPDKAFVYSGDSLIHNYFWYAFEKAFAGLGMTVANEDKPDLKAPAMWLTLKSVTDDKYEIEVTINKVDYLVFRKMYTITGDPVPEANRTKEFLEKRAYQMTNQLIQTILTDPAFKEAFFKTAAELASPPGR